MASMYPPKKNTAFTLYFSLYKNDGTIIANPGTYTKKVSIDGAAVADITASITEEDTTYGQLSVVLSTSEMNGDAIWVYIVDDTSGCVPFTCTLYTTANTQDEIGTDVAAVHTHVGTIDGHITADYGATEKNAIDLLDDADGGLADIHTVVNDLHTDVADVHTDVGTAITNIGDVHATDLPAVKAETALIYAAVVTNAAGADVAADIIALKAVADTIQADTDLLDDVSGGLADIHTDIGTLTTTVGAAGAGLTALASAAELAKVPKSDSNVSWNATALAAIQSEANDALVAYDPPTKAELDSAQGAVTLANGAHGGAAATLALGGAGGLTGAITGNLSGSVGSVTGNVGGNVAGSVASVTGAVGSVTGNVGGNVTGSVGSVAAGGITAASIATDAIDNDALAANAVTEIQAGLSTLDAAGVRTAVGLAAANLDTQLTAIDDYLDTEVAAILVIAQKLDTALELDGAVYRFTVNALENAPSGGGSLTAQQVWEYATRTLSDKTGFALTAAYDAAKSAASSAEVTALNDVSSADVQAAAAAALTAYDPPTRGEATSDKAEVIAALPAAAPTAAANADAVWNELIADHAGAGSAGAAIAAAGSAGDPWSTLIPGAYGAGTAGKILGTYIDAPISTVNTVADAIKQKTDLLGTATVTVTGPVISSDQVEIVQGDDYSATDSRELTFTSSSWPTLTGNTVEIVVDGTAYACTVTAADTFTCELTATQTAAMTEGTDEFTIVLTIGTRHLTIGRGMWTVQVVPEEDS